MKHVFPMLYRPRSPMARQGAGPVCADTRRGSSSRSPFEYSSNLRFLDPASRKMEMVARHGSESHLGTAGRPPKWGRRQSRRNWSNTHVQFSILQLFLVSSRGTQSLLQYVQKEWAFGPVWCARMASSDSIKGHCMHRKVGLNEENGSFFRLYV